MGRFKEIYTEMGNRPDLIAFDEYVAEVGYLAEQERIAALPSPAALRKMVELNASHMDFWGKLQQCVSYNIIPEEQPWFLQEKEAGNVSSQTTPARSSSGNGKLGAFC